MADHTNEPYMLYDTKERAFVSQKEYASRNSATRVAERKNQEYGAHRYQAEKYSDIINRQMPKGGGGSGGVSVPNTREMQLGADLDPKAMMKRDGYKKGGKVLSASSRADGCAQRGKTKGRMV